MSAWDRLDAELDAWRALDRTAPLWWRDDDACADSAALEPMLEHAGRGGVPIAVATIPAALEASLLRAIAGTASATIVQHGFAHRNHAPPAERKSELGTHRPLAAVLADLQSGFDALSRAFGDRFAPVLVPPWNRIDRAVQPHLASVGFRGLSTFGTRASATAAVGVAQANTHVDLIDWQRDRSFIGTAVALDKLVAALEARRTGRADALEPCGVLTHHLDMKSDAWGFMAQLILRTRENGRARWLDVDAVFGLA